MDKIIVKLNEYGSSFATRDRARAIGKKLRISAPSLGADIVVDFLGVRVVSFSFADQLLTEIINALHDWGHVHDVSFAGCSPEIIEVVETIIRQRTEIEPSTPSADVYGDKIALAVAL